jgi:riboflavin biosynthesis pyrimidine reductase
MMAVAPALGLALVPLLTDETPPARYVRGGRLPDALEERYGGPLAIALRPDRPTVVANFVSSLDGVVSYGTPEAAGGGEISGFFEPDRFVMGLLRALADVVLIGAGTLRAAPDERWTPGAAHPASAPEHATLRRTLGLQPKPITAVVTASGALDLAHPGLADPEVDVIVLTTDAGATRLAAAPGHVRVLALGEAVNPADALDALASHGCRLVLSEGGPHLLGQLVEARLVDELFLTLSPQLVGRSASVPRLGLLEGVAFEVAGAPWLHLADLRMAGDHLFTRYRNLGGPTREHP